MILFFVQCIYLIIKYKIAPIATTIKPKIVNHLEAFFFIKSLKIFPNLQDKKDTTKNLNPREIKQIIKNKKILNPIIPLVIVKTLNGKGVKPAKNNAPKNT